MMPDEMEMGGYTVKTTSLSDRAVVTIIAVGFFTMMGLIAISSYYGSIRKNEERVFLASCIEFQSVSRCRDLLHYGRQDLIRGSAR